MTLRQFENVGQGANRPQAKGQMTATGQAF